MSALDTLLVVLAVVGTLCVLALAVTLARLLAGLGELRRLVGELRHEVRPLLLELRSSTEEAREVVTEAGRDLRRFDRVLGSAEAITDAVSDGGRMARTALSTPVIKVAAVASGTRRAVRRLTGRAERTALAPSRSGEVVPLRRRRSVR